LRSRDEADARGSQQAGEGGCEVQIPLGGNHFRLLGIGIGEALWPVGDLPQRGRRECAANSISSDPERPSAGNELPIASAGDSVAAVLIRLTSITRSASTPAATGVFVRAALEALRYWPL